MKKRMKSKTEMQSAVKVLNSLPKNCVIQYPNSRWGFVGSVNAKLAYRREDGQPLTNQDCNDIASFGPGLLKHIKSRTYSTAQEAKQVATDLSME